MTLSVVCMLHCLALPALLAFVPFVAIESMPAWAHQSEWFHALLLIPVALVSGMILLGAARDRPHLTVLGAVGFTALATGLFAPSDTAELVITVFGASLIFVAHFLNLRAEGVRGHAKG